MDKENRVLKYIFTEIQVARICYEANRIYQISLGEDPSPPWEKAHVSVRNSTIAGVEARLVNHALTPQQQHEIWKADKVRDGWKYGKVKDHVMKTHPCIVDYADLPNAQRIKDNLFIAICDLFI